jgi:phosphoglycerate dehydrogenase-like enzyme
MSPLLLLLLQTIGFDPIIGADESSEFGVEWMDLDKLWPRADYITLHTPLIPQTKRKSLLSQGRNFPPQ